MSTDYDILIIGGGINGCGIARDAIGRGYSVYLCEERDLASGTSSQSTKLIHGGLRYLEYYEFRLVREALTEREVLWNIAPHLIHPKRFILPHHKGLRPAWLIRLGLFLYDHIGGRKKLPATTTINLKDNITGEVLEQNYNKAFEYSDCAVDDARLVILNALDAAERGASINTRSKCVSLKRENDKSDPFWSVTIEDQNNQKLTSIKAKIIINAGGPWADKILNLLQTKSTANTEPKKLRLVQGSHIIVPKIYSHEKCYIFQNKDKRITFAIPYQDHFTLIGTTDLDYQGDPHNVKITQNEIDYLCHAANQYFKHKTKPSDIVANFAGVRSLYNDGQSKAQEATRDYVLEIDQSNKQSAALINVFGGKITTYRRLAESVMGKVEGLLKNENKGDWTAKEALPGGDFKSEDFANLCDSLQQHYQFISLEGITRLVMLYGTRTKNLLADAKSIKDLGESFSHGLYQREVEYLMKTEWALNADDILWRRTKLGLFFNRDEKDKLENWIQSISTTDE